jgi:hypothetical protein
MARLFFSVIVNKPIIFENEAIFYFTVFLLEGFIKLSTLSCVFLFKTMNFVILTSIQNNDGAGWE